MIEGLKLVGYLTGLLALALVVYPLVTRAVSGFIDSILE